MTLKNQNFNSICKNQFHNIQIYICEFIINNQVDSLLDTLIELYSYYYASTNIQTISKFNKCIDIVKNNNSFKLCSKDTTFKCNKVLIATGGKSYPKTGSDGSVYSLCKNWMSVL